MQTRRQKLADSAAVATPQGSNPGKTTTVVATPPQHQSDTQNMPLSPQQRMEQVIAPRRRGRPTRKAQAKQVTFANPCSTTETETPHPAQPLLAARSSPAAALSAPGIILPNPDKSSGLSLTTPTPMGSPRQSTAQLPAISQIDGPLGRPKVIPHYMWPYEGLLICFFGCAGPTGCDSTCERLQGHGEGATLPLLNSGCFAYALLADTHPSIRSC